ncbi:MAG: 5-oxoprolinase subunit PxpA [Pseudomonadota bacterium]
MTVTLDLNADLGEGCASDAELMALVTSCNIACGGHAGDAKSMRTALQQARENGVAAGAHPSFPDRENFGRTKMDLAGPDLESSLRDQVQALRALADELDVPLTHLKPHGALYNMAASDVELARSILRVHMETMGDAALFGPPKCKLQQAAEAQGVRYIAEGFADRAYERDGTLRDRKLIGAVLHDPKDQTEQAISIATRQQVQTVDGEKIALPAQTLCVHGDTPTALTAARAIRSALEAKGIFLCPPN